MTTAPHAEHPSATALNASRRWLSRAGLGWAALGWTVLTWGAGALLIQSDLTGLQEQKHNNTVVRLDALHTATQIALRQMSALPQALAAQDSTQAFLARVSPDNVDAPAQSVASLRARPEVAQTSARLSDLARQLGLDALWLLDTRGQVLADSQWQAPDAMLGRNLRDRTFFNETADSGQALRTDTLGPDGSLALVFSVRTGAPTHWEGQVVARLRPDALQHLLQGPQRRILVTDPRGVVIAQSAPEAVTRRTTADAPVSKVPWQGRVPMQADTTPAVASGEADRTLPWVVTPLVLDGQRMYRVQADGRDWLAESRALPVAGLTAWSLLPLDDEGPLMAMRAIQIGLLWALGLGALALLGQRAARIRSLTLSEQALSHMAHALPLSVFCLEQPPQSPGFFSFLGDGAGALLGLDHQRLKAEPELAWQQVASAGPASSAPLLPPTAQTEYPVMRDGRVTWLACNSRMHTRADGTRVYNGFWTDITERKEVEARTLAVFRHAPLAFLFYRFEEGLIRGNPRAVELFGASDESELLGLQLMQSPLSDAQQRPQDLQDVQEAHSQRVTRTVEWRFTSLQGRSFDAELVLIPFEHAGQAQFCALVQDVTVRKQAETALRQAQAASQAAAEAKSRFLANMSHEIRTPMNAVMGMTHLALLEDLPTKARNYIDKAHRSANNLLQILNDVLDVSKIESGKMVLEYTDFQLEQVISHMADVLGMRAEDKGLELLFTAPPEMPTALIGDPIRLGQVLINLGTNAIKFTESGEVLIGCELEELQDDEVVLHFWVRDTGIGLAPDQVERLFQPFTQGDSSTTRQYGGTGLGLTISRELVQLMHGRIWVQSTPGAGSTFHFTARLGVQARATTRRALLAQELRDKRLLLVDDNPTAREVLGTMVSRLGLRVDTCASGPLALQCMQEAMAEGQPHHVLLTDWKMPGMDGITFARHALSLPPEQRPCVLLVTAFARDEALRAADGVGLAGILNKPVTPSTLLDTLSRALGQDAPAAAPGAATNRVLQNAQRQLAGARVLLVEDQPMNQELARDLLERAGLKVVTASHGAECLEKLATEGPFDGVLMDCQMPVMDGYTASERIRARSDWQSLPVIAMTASAMASDRERVLACGMNDHITKPLDLAQMFTIMARWIVPRRPVASATAPQATTPSAPLDADAPQTVLGSLDSLDTVDGLSRCMGNLNLYQRLLKGFAKTQHDFATQLAAAPEREAAIRVAHTLKGLAGNIGATRLHQAVSQMEAHMHSSTADDPSDLRAQVQSELALTLDALQAVLADIQRLNNPKPAITTHQRIELDDPVLQERLAELSALVTEHDAMARDCFQDLMHNAQALQGHPLMQQLHRALERYDFDDATQALDGLLSRTGV